MKRKLTLSVDEELVKFGKEYAARRGVSLSQFIERALRDARATEGPLFADQWHGKFAGIGDPDEERLRYLKERYG